MKVARCAAAHLPAQVSDHEGRTTRLNSTYEAVGKRDRRAEQETCSSAFALGPAVLTVQLSGPIIIDGWKRFQSSSIKS
jgi:hypothetical protein